MLPKQMFAQKNVNKIIIKYFTGDLSFVEVPSRVTSIFRFAHQNISLPPPAPPPLNLWLRACHPYLQLKLAHAYHVALIYLHHIAY